MLPGRLLLQVTLHAALTGEGEGTEPHRRQPTEECCLNMGSPAQVLRVVRDSQPVCWSLPLGKVG